MLYKCPSARNYRWSHCRLKRLCLWWMGEKSTEVREINYAHLVQSIVCAHGWCYVVYNSIWFGTKLIQWIWSRNFPIKVIYLLLVKRNYTQHRYNCHGKNGSEIFRFMVALKQNSPNLVTIQQKCLVMQDRYLPWLTHCGVVTPYGVGDLSQLVKVMACFLMAPSHCLNQCWLIISNILWQSSEDIIIRRFEDTNR